MSDTGYEFDLPQRFGPYELTHRIASGGGGDVFSAQLHGFGGFKKAVVIKRLRASSSLRADSVEMFFEEAKLGATIRHKNIVDVLDMGVTPSGDLYMAQEYIAGADLKGLIREANRRGLRIPPWLSLYIFCEVLEGLTHLHDLRGVDAHDGAVVHCDVTPENILVGFNGEVKLGDLGIARDESRPSPPSPPAGKLAYMSPEQLRGGQVDRRTDIYSAGVSLWESLTQRRLHGNARGVQLVRDVFEASRPPPSRYHDDIPEALDSVTLTALQADPARRFQRASMMQSLLQDLTEGMRRHRGPREIRKELRALLPSRPASAA